MTLTHGLHLITSIFSNNYWRLCASVMSSVCDGAS